ncbi:MAG: dihydropteroate synthase [Treponema sp.]|nr:dihydropteroate synthase [Treponema sp.]
MIIIGEKINGFIPSTAQAIRTGDGAYIRDLAIRQTEMGADYLDIAAGTSPRLERETLAWLIGVAQDAVDTPLCIDSADCQVLLDMIPLVKKPGILNSVSEEHGKCEALFSRTADSEWKIIALTCDERGISPDPELKYNIAVSIIQKAGACNIPADRLFIDPLVSALSTAGRALLNFTETLVKIKSNYPGVHIISGLSNISFGMPYRRAVNQQFLALAMSAGMDSVILDPTSGDMQAALYATEALLGRDKHCRSYLQAYRRGIFGPGRTKEGEE